MAFFGRERFTASLEGEPLFVKHAAIIAKALLPTPISARWRALSADDKRLALIYTGLETLGILTIAAGVPVVGTLTYLGTRLASLMTERRALRTAAAAAGGTGAPAHH